MVHVLDATTSALKSSKSLSTLTGSSSLVSSSPCIDPQGVLGGDNSTRTAEKDKAASDAAFELGMTLVGDDITVIEREMNERLGVVEEDLEGLIRDISDGGDAYGTDAPLNCPCCDGNWSCGPMARPQSDAVALNLIFKNYVVIIY